MNETQKLEWQSLKENFSYSQIKCFVCREYLYYGNSFRISKGDKNPKFKCKCKSKVVLNDKCMICNTPVEYEVVSVPAIRMRCTCGHSELVEESKITTTLIA